MTDWYDDLAFPLHAALDAATDMPAGTSINDRWALVMERCPWLTDRVPSHKAAVAPPEELPGDWWPLKSSNLAAMKVVGIGSTDVCADLIIRFKNGAHGRYSAVSYEDIAGLREAESPGGYFNTWIKSRYTHEKVT